MEAPSGVPPSQLEPSQLESTGFLVDRPARLVVDLSTINNRDLSSDDQETGNQTETFEVFDELEEGEEEEESEGDEEASGEDSDDEEGEEEESAAEDEAGEEDEVFEDGDGEDEDCEDEDGEEEEAEESDGDGEVAGEGEDSDGEEEESTSEEDEDDEFSFTRPYGTGLKRLQQPMKLPLMSITNVSNIRNLSDHSINSSIASNCTISKNNSSANSSVNDRWRLEYEDANGKKQTKCLYCQRDGFTRLQISKIS